MNTSIRHLSHRKQATLQSIIRIVRRAVNPEKIILFGLYGLSEEGVVERPEEQVVEMPEEQAVESPEEQPIDGSDVEALEEVKKQAVDEPDGKRTNERLSAPFNNCELLVVIRRGDRRASHELQDAIENQCRQQFPVTVLIHDIDYINGRLAEGHYFFTTLYREAILIYDAAGIPLVKPANPDLEKVRRLAIQDFDRWRKQSGAFFESALFNMERKEWKVAVFLLHQAAEHMYQAILLAFNGYKPTTHNLDKLRRYTNRFSIELALLFPCDTEEEERLFRLLLQGYVEARYNENYHITEEEGGWLAERIRRMASIGERICANRFISLGKMVSGI